ncbi:MAG: flagellar biosynthesis anti-sigma factor FlgM [Acidimicrobiia bacterium]|nr:flagellar biosynthesis anti-sigma factor FlgM [Acidimicrobiia bacterium]
MKIDHTNVGGAGASASDSAALHRIQQAGQAGSGPEKTQAGGAGDKIEISELGQRLRMLAVESPERAARLEQLSKLVESGRYEADSEGLSQRLIEDALGG